MIIYLTELWKILLGNLRFVTEKAFINGDPVCSYIFFYVTSLEMCYKHSEYIFSSAVDLLICLFLIFLDTVCRLRVDDDYQGLCPPCKLAFVELNVPLNWTLTLDSIIKPYIYQIFDFHYFSICMHGQVISKAFVFEIFNYLLKNFLLQRMHQKCATYSTYHTTTSFNSSVLIITIGLQCTTLVNFLQVVFNGLIFALQYMNIKLWKSLGSKKVRSLFWNQDRLFLKEKSWSDIILIPQQTTEKK